jgi:hypothetical protein
LADCYLSARLAPSLQRFKQLDSYQLKFLWQRPKETLNKSFDRLRTNGKWLISFVVSLSNHERNQLVQSFPKRHKQLNFLRCGCVNAKLTPTFLFAGMVVT